MAAWRGGRALTWMTGAVAFLVSIGDRVHRLPRPAELRLAVDREQAKDGLNSVGIGAWFNVLDFGQMLLWHVLLLPLVVGRPGRLHVLLVRRHGVVPPYRRRRPRRRRPTRRRCRDDRDASTGPAARPHRGPTPILAGPCAATTWSRSSSSRWSWSPRSRSLLAIVFSSPDEQADHAPELGQGRSGRLRRHRRRRTRRDQRDGRPTAPPYNDTPGAGQKLGPLPLQTLGRRPDPGRHGATTSCSTRCGTMPDDPRLTAALAAYAAAAPTSRTPGPAPTRTPWPRRPTATRPRSRRATTARSPLIDAALPDLAQSGGLDGALAVAQPVLPDRLHQAAAVPRRRHLPRGPGPRPAPARRPVGNDERDRQLPRPGLALALHLLVPDQAVLHAPDNADALVCALMALLSLALVCVPSSPGLRSLPRLLRVHRLIWRDHYRSQKRT